MIVSTTPRPLHLACVASVAATVMLALQCSSGDAKQIDDPIENTDVTDPSERIGAFPVIEDDAPDSGGPSGRVLDDATGKPIAGVLVFSMTRRGTPLGKRSTGADGTATGLPGMKRIYGLVAWHKDYELGGFVLGPGGADLRLKPATYLSVEIGASPGASPTDVNLEWHAACDTYLTYSCDLIGNPVSSGGDYLAYRVFLELGLNHHKWPVSGGKSEVPRYLINSGMLKLWSKSKLPNHLDRSGLLSPTPLAAKREPVELEKQNLKRATTETSMMPKPLLLLSRKQKQ